MIAQDPLDVLFQERHVALLEPAGGGAYRLRYDDTLIQDNTGAILLSVSMPIRAEPYPEDETRTFFDNLLPEGDARRNVSQLLHVGPLDTYGLLRLIGHECAGAISVVAPGTPQPVDDVEWLDQTRLAEIIDQLPARPLAVDPERGVRMSLAGGQDKFPVVIDGDRIGRPVGRTPSSHILKPPSTRRTGHGNLLYPNVVENEAFCLRLAQNSGIPAATADVRTIGDFKVLLVERYDRVSRGERRIRIHQEDMCQALAIGSDFKYEDGGGPDAARLIGILRDHSAAAATDVLSFVDRFAFNYLIGNHDAHAKNTSLLYTADGIRLSPAYDLVSTVVYPHENVSLAMRIGGQWQGDQVTARHWYSQLETFQLNTAENRQRLANFGAKVVTALEQTTDEAKAAERYVPLLDDIGGLVRVRAQVLQQLPDRAAREERRQRQRVQGERR